VCRQTPWREEVTALLARHFTIVTLCLALGALPGEVIELPLKALRSWPVALIDVR
jgi:hypothetical protein